MSGHLVLNGTYTIVVEGTPLEITVSDWETITSDNERMTGQFRLTFLVSGLQGALRIDGELRIVAKASTTPALTRGAGAGGFGRVLAQLLHKR